MFRKLLKLELLSVWQKYALAILGAFGCALLYWLSAHAQVEILSSLLFVTAVVGCVSLVVIHAVIQISRFAHTILGRGAYLTFSIPTGIHSILGSKLLSTLLYAAVTCCACLVNIAFIVDGASDKALAGALTMPMDNWGALLALMGCSYLMVVMCILLGFSIAAHSRWRQRKTGVFAGIAAAYALYQATGFLTIGGYLAVRAAATRSRLVESVMEFANQMDASTVPTFVLSYAAVAVLVIGIVYTVSSQLLEKHRQI